MRNIIRYVGIILVIAGILLVMKNLVTKDENFSDTSTNKNQTTEVAYYSAKIKLVDKETDAYLEGASFILKNEKDEIIEKWISESNVHLISKLKKGKYTIEQEKAPDGYHLNEEVTSFEVTNKDQEVVIYNTKMTEEEIEELRQQNTTSSEVSVDNTLSVKNIWAILGGICSIGLGIFFILIQKKPSNNDV